MAAARLGAIAADQSVHQMTRSAAASVSPVRCRCSQKAAAHHAVPVTMALSVPPMTQCAEDSARAASDPSSLMGVKRLAANVLIPSALKKQGSVSGCARRGRCLDCLPVVHHPGASVPSQSVPRTTRCVVASAPVERCPPCRTAVVHLAAIVVPIQSVLRRTRSAAVSVNLVRCRGYRMGVVHHAARVRKTQSVRPMTPSAGDSA